MIRNILKLMALLLCLLSPPAHSQSTSPAESIDMQITLDARDISRKLVHSEVLIYAGGDSLSVLFPKWIPGSHGPCGAIENMAGFRPVDVSGENVPWKRDYTDPFRFRLKAAGSSYPISISLNYVCGQPTPLSWGSDCWGTPNMGVINWNEVTVYPEGVPVRDLIVETRLILPAGWNFATAMAVNSRNGDTIIFKPVTYEELIDFPVICGRYSKTYPLVRTSHAEYFIDVVVDDENLLPCADSAFSDPAWVKLIYEVEALFGEIPFTEYHFLIPVSDEIGTYGMEHRNSNISSNDLSSLKDYGSFRFSHQWIMPHELVHAWCGKFHRPAGMATPDYQTPKNMDMLWVYEGFTDYVGMVLSARSGLIPQDYFMENLADYWGNLRYTAGRSWRPLRDIEVSTYTTWGGCENWKFYRLSSEYYPEGGLFWLEIDSRIREISRGKKSLDDLCRSFFATGDESTHCIPFTREELVSALSRLAEINWDSLIAVRTESVRDTLDQTPLHISGWEFDYTERKSKYVVDTETRTGNRYYYESIGLELLKDNKIGQIVPGGPADQAKLSTGMTVLGVNGNTFSIERLEKAITDAAGAGESTLLIQHGDTLQDYTINYTEGLRYLCLKQHTGQTNWLEEIIKPLTKK